MNILQRELRKGSLKTKRIQHRPIFNISALTLLKPSHLAQRIKANLTSRAGLFRLLLVGSAVHLVATFSGSIFLDRQITMSITDYLQNNYVHHNQLCTVYGVLKVGSVQVKRGTSEIKFTLTDHKNTIDLYYKGHLKFEFKEGETIVATGYCPDPSRKQQMVCVDYQTKHAMEVNDWQDASNKSRNNYGLK